MVRYQISIEQLLRLATMHNRLFKLNSNHRINNLSTLCTQPRLAENNGYRLTSGGSEIYLLWKFPLYLSLKTDECLLKTYIRPVNNMCADLLKKYWWLPWTKISPIWEYCEVGWPLIFPFIQRFNSELCSLSRAIEICIFHSGKGCNHNICILYVTPSFKM